MPTFKQEKTLAIFTTILVVIAVILSDKEDIVFLEPGAFIVYGIGLGMMWNNIRVKSKEQKDKLHHY